MEENTVEMPESPDHAQDDLPIICAEWEEQLPGHLNKQMFSNDCRQYRNKGVLVGTTRGGWRVSSPTPASIYSHWRRLLFLN